MASPTKVPRSRVPKWATDRFTPKLVALLALLFTLSQAIIGAILGPVVGRDLGAMQSFALIKPSIFRELAAGWGADEVDRFERHFLLDFVLHPAIYSLFFVGWVALEASQRQVIPLHYETWAGLIGLAGVCDVIENFIHWSMLPDLTKAGDSEIRAAAVFSMMKWLIMVPTGVWCLSSLIARRGKMIKAAAD